MGLGSQGADGIGQQRIVPGIRPQAEFDCQIAGAE